MLSKYDQQWACVYYEMSDVSKRSYVAHCIMVLTKKTTKKKHSHYNIRFNKYIML